MESGLEDPGESFFNSKDEEILLEAWQGGEFLNYGSIKRIVSTQNRRGHIVQQILRQSLRIKSNNILERWAGVDNTKKKYYNIYI